MLTSNSLACKEWAVVCAALATGRQTILLRKGGIQEESGTFRVEQPEFWLFPTAFHQLADALSEDARPLWEQTQREIPPAGTVRIAQYVQVERVWRVRSEEQAVALAPLHILAEAVVRQRFHYREPGLNVLAVRVFQTPAPFVIADAPDFAGCKSWVPLGTALPTSGLLPVLSDEVHAARLQKLGDYLPIAFFTPT